MGKEKLFENKVKALLKDKGCWFVKYWGGGEFTKSGVPDILCCCNGRFLGIEVKASDGRPSPLQLHNLQKIEDSGGIGILLYPEKFNLFSLLVDCILIGDEVNIYKIYDLLKGRCG